MKNFVLNALAEKKTVTFRFGKENNFSADVLIDEMIDEPNLILVGQNKFSSNTLINLELVQRIKISN